MNRLIRGVKSDDSGERILKTGDESFVESITNVLESNHVPEVVDKKYLAEVFHLELEELKKITINHALADAEKKTNSLRSEYRETISSEIKNEYLSERKSLDEKISVLISLLTEVESCKKIFLKNESTLAIELTLECLYKLTAQKDIYRNVVTAAIERALIQKKEKDKLIIHLPESCSDVVELISASHGNECVLVVDSKLTAGSCFVEMGYSKTSMSLDILLSQLGNALVSELKNTNATDE